VIAEIFIGLWFFTARNGGQTSFAYISPPYRTQTECEAARLEFPADSNPCEQRFVWVTYDSSRQK